MSGGALPCHSAQGGLNDVRPLSDPLWIPKGAAMTEIVIIEDDASFREGLAQLLQSAPGLRCRETFSSCEEALVKLGQILPDVVLLDLELGENMPGVEGAARIKQLLPDVDILILTVHDEDQYVFAALRAGAAGYLLKSDSPDEIIASIREAQNGGAPMSMQIARMVVHSFKERPLLPSLTERQREILKRLCEGKSYQAIAQELFITKYTVKFHIKHIYEAMHVHSKTEALRMVLGK